MDALVLCTLLPHIAPSAFFRRCPVNRSLQVPDKIYSGRFQDCNTQTTLHERQLPHTHLNHLVRLRGSRVQLGDLRLILRILRKVRGERYLVILRRPCLWFPQPRAVINTYSLVIVQGM